MPVRTDIRDAIVTAIDDSSALTTAAVVGRTDAWPLTSLPAARVTFESEEITHLSAASSNRRTRNHEARFLILLAAQKTASLNVEDNLDTLLQTIEDQIDADTTLGVTEVQDAKIVEISYEITGDADKPTGLATAVVQVNYVTVEA